MRFTVDTSPLPNLDGLSYEWTSTATSGIARQPTFEVTLPSPPRPVTVSVSVDDKTSCKAFGTITFTPLTVENARRVALLCALRNLVTRSLVSRKAVQGARDRVWFLVDPIWDPIRGELAQPFLEGTAEVQAALAELKQMEEQLHGLLGRLERRAGKQSDGKRSSSSGRSRGGKPAARRRRE